MPINFEEVHLGFLDVVTLEANNGQEYHGALLVTNDKTQPLSFIGTDPIRPTTFQQILYGKVFVPYLRDEVLGARLFKSYKGTIDVVFVQHQSLLKLRGVLSMPVCWINKEALTETGNGQEPITVHSLYPNDLNYCREVYQHLRNVLQNEVLEPFDRIRIALNELRKHPHSSLNKE